MCYDHRVSRKHGPSILVVEIDARLRSLLEQASDRPLIRILHAAETASALTIAREDQIDLILLSTRVPDGLAFVDARERDMTIKRSPLVLVTDADSDPAILAAVDHALGASQRQ
jgi:DNA-binding response OmpR family regulator